MSPEAVRETVGELLKLSVDLAGELAEAEKRFSAEKSPEPAAPSADEERIKRAAAQIKSAGLVSDSHGIDTVENALRSHDATLDLVLRLTEPLETPGRPVKAASVDDDEDKESEEIYESRSGEKFRDPYGIRDLFPAN